MQSAKENEHIIALATPADISVKFLHSNKPFKVEVDNEHAIKIAIQNLLNCFLV